MPAIDKFGRLKKNPLLGQSFGRGPEGDARREAYMGLHGELKQHLTSGGEGSLADVARKRFRRWGDPRMAAIKQHQGAAAELEPQLRDWSIKSGQAQGYMKDLWGQRSSLRARGHSTSDVMDKYRGAHDYQSDLASKLQAGQTALAGHQEAIRSGRGAYQSRQNLYNRFFGRSVY